MFCSSAATKVTERSVFTCSLQKNASFHELPVAQRTVREAVKNDATFSKSSLTVFVEISEQREKRSTAPESFCNIASGTILRFGENSAKTKTKLTFTSVNFNRIRFALKSAFKAQTEHKFTPNLNKYSIPRRRPLCPLTASKETFSVTNSFGFLFVSKVSCVR